MVWRETLGGTNTIDSLVDDETRRSFLKKDTLITVDIGAILENNDWCQEPKMGRNQG